jgi:hypothetical protein
VNGPRSKNVTVGGREFVVRPMLVRVAEELQADKGEDGIPKMCRVVAAVLQRTAPDVTAEWLRENADVPELGDVMLALSEVSGGTASKGEATAP